MTTVIIISAVVCGILVLGASCMAWCYGHDFGYTKGFQDGFEEARQRYKPPRQSN